MTDYEERDSGDKGRLIANREETTMTDTTTIEMINAAGKITTVPVTDVDEWVPVGDTFMPVVKNPNPPVCLDISFKAPVAGMRDEGDTVVRLTIADWGVAVDDNEDGGPVSGIVVPDDGLMAYLPPRRARLLAERLLAAAQAAEAYA